MTNLFNILKQSDKKDPLKTICDLKWNYPIFMFNRSEFRSCCRTTPNKVTDKELEEKGIDAFLNSDSMIKSRHDLATGVKSPDCRTCWKLEEVGASSPRSHPNEFWRHLQTANFVDKNESPSTEKILEKLSEIDSRSNPMLRSYHPKMLEVSLGNTCDMKCMYCSHHYSSQWAAERIKYGEITQEEYDTEFPKPSKLFIDKFWEWFNEVGRHSVERIGLIGGEPLIIPEFYEFVDRIIESVSEVADKREKKLAMWIVTNGNTPPLYLEKFLQYMPKLTKHFDLEILISMESLGKKAEYIRNGINWERFNKNVNTLLGIKHLNFKVGFILSQNILSITSIKETVQYIENLYFTYGKPISFKQATVTNPTWQNPTNLTPDFAKYIEDAILHMKITAHKMPIVEDYFGRYDRYIHFLSMLAQSIRNNTTDVTADRKMFASWYDHYDKRRGLNLLETFPEYENFYRTCANL
jgi:Radical SAM superfamily